MTTACQARAQTRSNTSGAFELPLWNKSRAAVTSRSAALASRFKRARYAANAMLKFEKRQKLPNIDRI